MKEDPQPRDIAAEGPAFATCIHFRRSYMIETEEEAKLLYRYAKELTKFINGGREYMFLHGLEAMFDMGRENVSKLRFERNCIYSRINSFTRRTFIRIYPKAKRVASKADPRYFDVEEYKRETKP